MRYFRCCAITLLVCFAGLLTAQMPIGDTLTVIQRPLLSVPQIVTPGQSFIIECNAPAATQDWSAQLVHEGVTLPLTLVSQYHDADFERWFIEVQSPTPGLYELYDLRVSAEGIEPDTEKNAVHLVPEYKTDYTFVHLTDTHLPTHYYYYEPESLTDSTEVDDLREVIRDINLIHPEFVLFTGDVVNEGELEDFQNRRYFTRAKRLLAEFEVPVYIVAGNHDVGGWDATPEPDGTARYNWWKFFGWPRLDDPPPADPYYTQNYSFEYDAIVFLGMEAYINYDDFRYNIYGGESFTNLQMLWLQEQLELHIEATSRVLFYHYDFDNQIDLQQLGIEMGLWGHIHSNSGSIYTQPYDLATESVCDGNRAFRLISVNDNVLQPHNTMYAGAEGQRLEIDYLPSNSGVADSVTAVIVNLYSQSFTDARIKFIMPAGDHGYTLSGGELLQVDRSGQFNVCYVSADLPAGSNIEVSIATDYTAIDEASAPQSMVGLRCYPNPFNPDTTISFTLHTAGDIELTVFNVAGQRVQTLLRGRLQAGQHTAQWNGSDQNGESASSGIYIYELSVNGERTTGKCLLLK
ncbi:MAG: metallophosphoesterase [Candidatus Cloacimonetes bacterium]|nr:metallophosphoesterase [Candidatus Cloacimonadota bacterium]